MMIRTVEEVFHARETMEGAGVRLHRAFGYHQIPRFDPFLMLDDFRGDKPEDYLKGFPWHPHRGIETVTYMLEGMVEHGDSMGNAGTIGAGAVQWMTAGSGIIHQEMPKPVDGKMGGFQLWVNLPRSEKMRDPRYQEIPAEEIPVISPEQGVTIRIIAGSYTGIKGPVREIVADPDYLDVSLEEGRTFLHQVPRGYTVFCYVFAGKVTCGPGETLLENRNLARLSDGDHVQIKATAGPCRLLLLSGRPIREPIAWGGPIVMNTQEELEQAFREYEEGTFIKATSHHPY
nr:pirin family protein [uncultured Methanospirillum sp.]